MPHVPPAWQPARLLELQALFPALPAALLRLLAVLRPHQPRKEKTMSEASTTTGQPAGAPIATAGADPAAPLDHVQLVAQAAPAITQAALNTPGVPAHHAYDVAANVLSTLIQELPAILQVSRASPRTSAEVALSAGFLAALLQAFAPKTA